MINYNNFSDQIGNCTEWSNQIQTIQPQPATVIVDVNQLVNTIVQINNQNQYLKLQNSRLMNDKPHFPKHFVCDTNNV